MADILIDLLKQYPWLAWLWLGATVLATVLRSTWPISEERPRWVVAVLAFCDVFQFNVSGPVKLAFNRKAMAARAQQGSGE